MPATTTPLTVVSLFAGVLVGGFDLAFQRAGAEVVAAVEIDAPARTVLAKRFPNTALFNDVTEVSGDDLRAVGFVPERGILTGGFPCQDLSVAGRRDGLAGTRSGLFWHIVRLLAELHPAWFVLENVPGLLSAVCKPECPGGCMATHGGAMGTVLGALGDLGYGIAYRVLDAKYFGVPQQRRRVFIVGHLGEPFGAAAQVLFESESSSGDSAAGSETRAGIAAVTPGSTGSVGVTDHPPTLVCVTGVVTHTLTSEGADASEEGTGRGTPIVAACLTARYGKGVPSDADDAIIVQPLAIRGRDGGAELEIGTEGGPYNCLRAGNGGSSRSSLIAITVSNDSSPVVGMDAVGALKIGTGLGLPSAPSVLPANGTIVRRLTPTECERLQGFPDGHTEGQSDAQRYRQMGNAVAVPVVEWIARRLIEFDGAL